MTEEMPQRVLPTATGFAAREVLAALRKQNIATAPLVLRAGLSESALMRLAHAANARTSACRRRLPGSMSRSEFKKVPRGQT